NGLRGDSSLGTVSLWCKTDKPIIVKVDRPFHIGLPQLRFVGINRHTRTVFHSAFIVTFSLPLRHPLIFPRSKKRIPSWSASNLAGPYFNVPTSMSLLQCPYFLRERPLRDGSLR